MRTIITLFTVLLTINMSAQEKDSTLIFDSTTNEHPVLHIYTPSQKDLEFGIAAPTLLLMELYMEDTKNDSVWVSDERWNMFTPFKIKRPNTFEDFYNWTKEYFKEQLKD